MIKIQLASLLLLLSFAVHAQTEYYSLNSPDSNVHWKVKPQQKPIRTAYSFSEAIIR